MTSAPGAIPDLRPYRLVVFDLDGTLYSQRPVRLGMLSELLLAPPAEGGPGRRTRLSVLRRFRHLREDLARSAPKDFDGPLFARLSAETGLDEAVLRPLIKEWMELRSLHRLMKARIPGSHDLFAALRNNGTQIAVWSDYPVDAKLAALDLTADHVLSALDPQVAALKPNPAGLLWLLDRTGLPPEKVLMVGDRDSHDGAAARAAGVDFLLRAKRGPRGIPRVSDFRAIATKIRSDR